MRLRLIIYIAYYIALAIIISGLVHLAGGSEQIWYFMKAAGIVWVAFHLLPYVVSRMATSGMHVVKAKGNAWRVGKYDEAALRDLARHCVELLGANAKSPKIIISDHRETNGFTMLSFFRRSKGGRQPVWISAGALHYLDPVEMKALILHELAHHERGHRLDIPFGWLVLDLMLLLGFINMGFPPSALAVGFVVSRSVMGGLLSLVTRRSAWRVEHLCDLKAAQVIGNGAVANMLLKMGEEAELMEALLARSAKRLLYNDALDMDDLAEVLERVRPYGRVFHENLFRHSNEMNKEVSTAGGTPVSKKIANAEFELFLKKRRAAWRPRIRWRTFDRDQTGSLSDAQIEVLLDYVRTHPEEALFFTETEYASTSHPGFRDRMLFIFG